MKSHFSHHWYKVSSLKPSLRNHVEIHRQMMRGKIWYVLQDMQSGRYFRISPSTYAIIVRLDGTATVESIWQEEGQKLGKDHPTQDEMIELIAHLYRSDLIRGDIPIHMTEFVDRSDKMARQKIISRITNPMALRFPLIDPDKFLEKILPVFGIFFSFWGFMVWTMIVASASIIAVQNWAGLTSNLSDRVLSADNILILLIIYPIIKALHEIGHGLAVKAWGGEVHEMGIMFLVFMPVPYVDASASFSFKSKWQRAAVGAAGIFVECLLAAIALFVWLNAEPGLVRAAAFNVMLIGGVSTVLFNGNPLLKFDGYYVFSDLLNIPNLGSRANKYIFYLIQKYGFGISNVDNPSHSKGEARWFVSYGILAFVYRMVIMVTIALFVATKFFFFGVLIAGFAVFNSLVKPVLNGISFLRSSPKLGNNRGKAKRLTFIVVGILVFFLFIVPAPHSTNVEGVLFLNDDARLLSGASGFVEEINSKPGESVSKGDVLIRLTDKQLDMQVRLLNAEVKELTASFDAVNLFDRVQADILSEQLIRAKSELEFHLKRQKNLIIKSAIDGKFVLPDASDIKGRYIQEGQLIGHVIPHEPREVRIVVPQSRISLVASDVKKVEIRSEAELPNIILANISRETPSTISSLPSPILANNAGGTVAINPQNAAELEPLELYYQIDLLLDKPIKQSYVDGRIYAQLFHTAEPLGFQWLRSIRQVFLSMLNV